MSFLLKNAKDFEELAYISFEKGKYNLAAFAIEQAIQLYLKHLLFEKVGDFPKTHSFSLLFKEASKICKDLEDFYKKNYPILRIIYDSYFQTRYFPTSYSKEEVELMLKALEEFKEVIAKCL